MNETQPERRQSDTRIDQHLQDINERFTAEELRYEALAARNWNRIDKVFRWTRWMTTVVIIAMLLGGFFTIKTINENSTLTKQVHHNQQTTTNALCALRTELQRRVATNEEFLRKNPHGIPGISPATIQTSIMNSQRTVTALQFVVCRG